MPSVRALQSSYSSCKRWLSNSSTKLIKTQLHGPFNILLKKMLNQHFENGEPTFFPHLATFFSGAQAAWWRCGGAQVAAATQVREEIRIWGRSEGYNCLHESQTLDGGE